MSIRLLRTLVAISDEKTFSAAAERVHVTHAAVSQQMQSLEAELGLQLFDRTTGRPKLTPLARDIVEKARKLVADYDGLVSSTLADGGLRDGISLGVVPTTLTGLAPRAMATLRAAHPDMGLHLRPGLTRALLVELERGRLDAALISQPHLMPAGMAFHPLAEEPMELIAAHEETETDPLQLLTSRPFIRFNRDAVVGAQIDNWILLRKLRIQETMELDSLEAIASMVRENLGVSIVPRLSVPPRDGLPVKRLDLGPDSPCRTLGLAFPEDSHRLRAIDVVLGALRNVIGEGELS